MDRTFPKRNSTIATNRQRYFFAHSCNTALTTPSFYGTVFPMKAARFFKRQTASSHHPAMGRIILPKSNARAFTRVELMVMLGALVLLMLVAIPLLANPAIATQRAVCANNLRQISQAFRTYAAQNDDRFPWTGTNAPITTYCIAAQAEIGTPRILVCPSDSKKTVANNFSWGVFTSGNLSYLLNCQARANQAGNWMLGDRNINLIYTITNSTLLAWQADDNHGTEGNVVTVDGRVEHHNTVGLRAFVDRVLANQYCIEVRRP